MDQLLYYLVQSLTLCHCQLILMQYRNQIRCGRYTNQVPCLTVLHKLPLDYVQVDIHMDILKHPHLVHLLFAHHSSVIQILLLVCLSLIHI